MENRGAKISRMTVATTMATRYSRAVHSWTYVSLAFWSFMLFDFTIARLVYTLSPRSDRFLNNGQPFYESSVMELNVCAILGMAFSGVMIFVLRYRQNLGFLSTNGFEIGVLALFWFLWVGGAGSATSIWPDLNFCVRFSTCRVLQAMMAWAWLGWITINFLLLVSLFYAIKYRRWYAQIPQAWEFSNPSPPDFTIDGDERTAGPKMKERANTSTEEEGIDPNNYEFERWKRAVTWLQEENPHFVKDGKNNERRGPSTLA